MQSKRKTVYAEVTPQIGTTKLVVALPAAEIISGRKSSFGEGKNTSAIYYAERCEMHIE